MVAAVDDSVSKAWDIVREWPPEWRRSLASQLLQSLEEGRSGDTGESMPADLIGAWSVAQPPSDADVDHILEEERQRKYG